MFFSIPIRVEHLIHELYADLNLKEPEIKERKLQDIKLDDKDKKILAVLNEDSSQAYLTIAKKLGMTMDIVRYRIKNMIDNGVIIKFFSEIALRKLGYTQYLYKIRLKNISREKIEKLKLKLKNNNNITYAFFDITGFNIIFTCAFKDADGIDHLSRSIRKEFSDVIAEQDYLIIKEQIAFNLFPRGIIEL
jgi:DNA-binding Lrp family transcriptional regulator